MPYYRRNLFILSFTTFLSAFSWNQLLPFLPLFLKELGVTKDLPFWSGLLFAVQYFAAAVMGPIWGKVADKYGRKPMVIRAGFSLAVLYLGMSLCQNFWQLAVLRVMNGILTGFIPSSIALIATNTPKEESGRYVSIAYSASAAGTIMGPVLGGLMAGIFGIRASMVLSGCLVAVAVILVLLFVEEREKPVFKKATSIWQDFREAFMMPVLLTVMAFDMINALVLMAIQPVLALHINQIAPHASQAVSGAIFSLPSVALCLTAYTWSRIGERITYQRGILIGLSGVGLWAITLGLVNNVWPFAVIYFLLGVFAAAVTPLAAALIATKINSEFRGRAYGMQQTARMVGSSLGPLGLGIVGSYFGLNWLFIVAGVVCLGMTLGVRSQVQSWEREEVTNRSNKLHNIAENDI